MTRISGYPMGEFARQVVVITGGGAGIGKATALLFGREKANIAIIDCDEKAARRTVKEIQRLRSAALFLKADVGNSRHVKAAFEEAVKQFGRIDILFANAAVQVIKPIDSTSDDDWERVTSTNLRGTFLCCREAIPIMRRQHRGCIIIASSGHAFHSYPGYTAYASSKGGQIAMMRAMAIDCAPDGIRVNCIVPGATETELLRAHFSQNPEEKARLLSQIPMARLAAPDDIARAVRLLASRDASYITGSYLVVDGGLLAQG